MSGTAREPAKRMSLWQYLLWLGKEAKEKREMIDSFGPFIIALLSVAAASFHAKIGIADETILKGIAWAAASWGAFNFFLLKPFHKHREDHERIEELEASLTPRLELSGSPVEMSGQINLGILLTNPSQTTAQDIAIEVVELERETVTPNWAAPHKLTAATTILHPGGETKVEFARADYAVAQEKHTNGSKIEIVTDPRINLTFGSGMGAIYVSLKINADYRIRLRAMAKDFPVTDKWFSLRFSEVSANLWRFTLTKDTK